MRGVIAITVLMFELILISSPCPLSSNARLPVMWNATLNYCPYNGTTCCNYTEYMQLQEFKYMNSSDRDCVPLARSILCAMCDQISGKLSTVDAVHQTISILCDCNSTSSTNSSESNQAAHDFSSKVWRAKSRPAVNVNVTHFADLWQSKTELCSAFGEVSRGGGLYSSDKSVSLKESGEISPTDGLCLEKIGNGSYLNMVAHPDGSGRAFFSSQSGKIWLASIPGQDSGRSLDIDESSPFMDLTDRVHFDSQFGMMGMVFHPKFTQNGRFFVSYNCDMLTSTECNGRCSCNLDAGCDPSKVPPSDNTAFPCQYQTIVVEYSANGTSSKPSQALTARPVEVRRIFSMGIPFSSHHGGQILFGPGDGYLYFMMGDGGSQGDPFNLSQNKKSVLGKIFRLDIDNIPSDADIKTLDLWGNYSIPSDNPFKEDNELLPEIWALGLRNPRRCSFDSERPEYFLCGDVGQDIYEEVNLINKGGNYGWRIYEGPHVALSSKTNGNISLVESSQLSFPVMGYSHSEVNKKVKSASVTGGYFYRSMTDPCMYGRYLYGDLYAAGIWAGTETPENSGNFTATNVNFSCAHDSPRQCSFMTGSSVPSLGYIFSFGEDNSKDLYILASTGVYRLVRPSRCGFTCSKENATTATASGPNSSPHSHARQLNRYNSPLLVLYFLMLLLLMV